MGTEDQQREKTKREFNEFLDESQAALYVTLDKKGTEPAKCHTGGMKLPGNISVPELARGLGAILGDLVSQTKEAMNQQGKRLSDDDILTTLAPLVFAGARNRIVTSAEKGTSRGNNGRG